MTRLAHKAAVLTAFGLLAVSAAMAGVPNATNSSGVTVTGAPNILVVRHLVSSGTAASAKSANLITVRDAANNPVANSVVTINFSTCYAGPDGFKIASTQPSGAGGSPLTVNCGAHTISATTNASGVVNLMIVGYSVAASASAPGISDSPSGCASVTADGVPLGTMSVGTPDLNGVTGTNGSDFLQFSAALVNAASCAPCYRSRVNFSNAGGTGLINGSDFLVFSGFLIEAGNSSPASVCP